MPKRIQRKRTKGWRMPPNTVYVGRPSKWGNPFSRPETFRYFLMGDVSLGDAMRHGPDIKCNLSEIGELRGKNLACWCRLGQPCHADVLLEIANRE